MRDAARLLESTPVVGSATVLLRPLQNPRGTSKDFWNQDAEETVWIPFKMSLGLFALSSAAPGVRRIESVSSAGPQTPAPTPWQPGAGPTALPESELMPQPGTWGERCGWGCASSKHATSKSVRMSFGMEENQTQLELWNLQHKRSHSELHALLHNTGTRRHLMALKGLELKTKGHDFLCFVFGALRLVLCDGWS